ncbi:chorismate mutase [Bacillus chungangensis]|uniref:chorismate mutase n=1 Tax=Bacillus chungangensis TaxID=587633 RepID=A0ABT9WSC6_9BACI|nr:chorismate mutase [Bacillus chungangensis]MDQ0176196.1 chorismate mutase [Bacillus chungangensis]
MIRGIRGATTVTDNDEQEILKASEELIGVLIEKNNISPDNVVSVFISLTPGLDAAFPAKALRMFPNWTYVPVMCMQEIPVKGSLPHCIRIMMHVQTETSQADIQHVYLRGAISLRPDLSIK